MREYVIKPHYWLLTLIEMKDINFKLFLRKTYLTSTFSTLSVCTGHKSRMRVAFNLLS